jgi:hypothetical protein
MKSSVARIPDVYPGSRILIFTHPGSRIPDLGSRILIFTHPGSRVPDLGSRILIFTHPGSRVPDLGSRIQKQQQKRGVKKKFCHTFFSSQKISQN